MSKQLLQRHNDSVHEKRSFPVQAVIDHFAGQTI